MERTFYLTLAESGAAVPIGTHLVVHESADPDEVISDGLRLGKAVEETARRFRTPLAFPLMDLSLEKSLLCDILGVPSAEINNYHFDKCPSDEMILTLKDALPRRSIQRMDATCSAITYISRQTELLPVGMCIGPFSLMTKLVADAITPTYLFGMGMTPDEDDSVAMIKKVLDLSCMVIKTYIHRQIEAGARAIILCEPAANTTYISPKQLNKGSDVFERCVMDYLFEINALLDTRHVDLILHDCGELTDDMLKQFANLDPVILSLGSSRKLWEDASMLPKSIVLYGNLPSKHFYSDTVIPTAQVIEKSQELVKKMSEVGHPFILGTECDVLSVPGAAGTILEKVMAMVNCDCH